MIILSITLGAILAILIVLNIVTKKEMETEVVFDTPKEKVWKVLTENEKYPEWNPFITSSLGEMKIGANIINVMNNKGKETTFRPVITVLEEYKSLEWLGSGLGGMFKGNHYFHLVAIEDAKTKMLHGEKFSGFLSGLIMQMIAKDTHANFELMNAAMKKRVEENS